MGTICVFQHDMGSAGALTPALEILKKQHDVIAFTRAGAPSQPIFEKAGFTLRTLPDFTDETVARTKQALIRELLIAVDADCVVVGVSATNAAPERFAIEAAWSFGIPVLALVESWPHRWLASYGERDLPHYLSVHRICVQDSLSQEKLYDVGFESKQVALTGNPLYDNIVDELATLAAPDRSKVREHFGIADNALVFLWATTADLDDPREDNPSCPEWLGYSEADALTEFLTAVADAQKRHPDRAIEAIVRVKPTYTTAKIAKLIKVYCPTARLDQVRNGGTPTIFASDLIAGMATLVLEQAAARKKPVVSYTPNLSRPDIELQASKLGVVVPLYGVGELATLIHLVAADPVREIAIVRSRQKPFITLTNAAGNVAAEIDKLLLR